MVARCPRNFTWDEIMTIPKISDARRMGVAAGAAKVAIVTIAPDRSYPDTPWGDTAANGRARARWAGGEQATQTLEAIANTLPTAGVIDVALEPDAGAFETARKDLLTEIRRIISETGNEQGSGTSAIGRIERAMKEADERVRREVKS
jgi:hypothetical protein